MSAANGAANPADDSGGNAEFLAEGIADGGRKLAHGNLVAVAKRGWIQKAVRVGNLENCQVRIRVAAEKLGFHFHPIGQHYDDPVCLGYDVVVGYNVPLVVPHKAGPAGTFKEVVGNIGYIGDIGPLGPGAQVPGNTNVNH